MRWAGPLTGLPLWKMFLKWPVWIYICLFGFEVLADVFQLSWWGWYRYIWERWAGNRKSFRCNIGGFFDIHFISTFNTKQNTLTFPPYWSIQNRKMLRTNSEHYPLNYFSKNKMWSALNEHSLTAFHRQFSLIGNYKWLGRMSKSDTCMIITYRLSDHSAHHLPIINKMIWQSDWKEWTKLNLLSV